MLNETTIGTDWLQCKGASEANAQDSRNQRRMCVTEADALLNMMKKIIAGEAPENYDRFYQAHKDVFNMTAVKADYERMKQWYCHVTLESLKELQTMVVADFLKKDLLRSDRAPTKRELLQVRLDKVEELLPADYELPEDFSHQCAKFRRYISWDGDILVINYNDYGRFMCHNLTRLSLYDLVSLFEFDILLSLIHQDMRQMAAAELRQEPKRESRSEPRSAPTAVADFGLLVCKPEKAALVTRRLHELMEGKTRPKDVLMPVRAAMDAGALRRPTWPEFCNEFGRGRLRCKSSLSNYTQPDIAPYQGSAFDEMVKEFRNLIL